MKPGRRSKYNKKLVKAAITKAAEYRLIKNGNWSHSYGYRFTYRHETAEILGCAYKHVDKLVRKFELREHVDKLNERKRAKHIKKVNNQKPKVCTLCKIKKPHHEFGKFSRLFAGKRKICKLCLKKRDGGMTHRQTFKFRKPESHAKTRLIEDLKRIHGITIDRSELSEDMVEAKMRALDLHREIKAIRKEKEKGEKDRKCSRCEEVKARTHFKSDYNRPPNAIDPYWRVSRCFICRDCRKQWYKDYKLKKNKL